MKLIAISFGISSHRAQELEKNICGVVRVRMLPNTATRMAENLSQAIGAIGVQAFARC